MALSFKATGAWFSSNFTGPTVPVAGTPAAGDRMFIWASWKDFSTTASVANWTKITEFTDGSVSSAASVGSVKVGCWYRDFQVTGDDVGTVTFSVSTTIGSVVMQSWQKGAGETWGIPTFVTQTWPSAIGPATQSASTATAVANGAAVMCLMGFRNDSATMTRTTTSLSASPAMTWNGNYVESPATHASTVTGDDMSADLGYRLVTTGHASTTLSTETTLSAAETGAILWVVQGVTTAPNINKSLSVAVRRVGFY